MCSQSLNLIQHWSNVKLWLMTLSSAFMLLVKYLTITKANNYFQRLHLIEKEFSGASLLFLYQAEIGPRLSELWCAKKLLDILEQLLGSTIAGHPIFAIRPKLPANSLFIVPWHQDTAYLLPEAESTDQVTCWIPFCDVNLNNGCLQY